MYIVQLSILKVCKTQLKSPSLSPLCLNIGVRLPPQFQLNVPQVSKETKTRLRLWQKYVEIIDSVRNSGDWIKLAVLLETQNAVITDNVTKSDTVPLQVRISCAQLTSFDVNFHQISFHLRLRWGGGGRQVDKDKKKSKRKESNAQPAHSHPDLGAELPASFQLTDWLARSKDSVETYTGFFDHQRAAHGYRRRCIERLADMRNSNLLTFLYSLIHDFKTLTREKL